MNEEWSPSEYVKFGLLQAKHQAKLYRELATMHVKVREQRVALRIITVDPIQQHTVELLHQIVNIPFEIPLPTIVPVKDPIDFEI